MASLLEKAYNPDVLTCLANLSNDEVFTPPELANDVLDMLPPEIWSDPTIKILDPCCKSGVFLREAAKRFIKGLAHEYPDLQERVDHIMHEQLFGIAITELTSLLSRRSLYCSKFPNGKFSVSEFDSFEGNVRFSHTDHTWENGTCIHCRASKSMYDRSSTLETHAYSFIHPHDPFDWQQMKFDVIIGNPPYQLSDGGNAASAVPIYHLFVQQAMRLQPRYLSMIIPSRWFTGGRGLDSFRNDMLNDRRITELHDFRNASDCFPGVEIKGGVCYFLWTRDSKSNCSIYSHSGNTSKMSVRPLLEKGMSTFVRDDSQISILHKVRAKEEATLDTQLHAGRFFGFHTRVTWEDNGIDGALQTADGKGSYPIRSHSDNDFDTKVYIARGECWIRKQDVTRNAEHIEDYKVLIPEAGNPGGSILGKLRLGEPGSCSSNTYIVYLAGNSASIAKNVETYLKTRFARYLIAMMTSTQHMAPRAYSLVPLQDFSRSISDEMLYAKYNLSPDEINSIEEVIPEMD